MPLGGVEAIGAKPGLQGKRLEGRFAPPAALLSLIVTARRELLRGASLVRQVDRRFFLCNHFSHFPRQALEFRQVHPLGDTLYCPWQRFADA